MIWAITAALLFAALDLLWRTVLAQSSMWTALLGRIAVSAMLLLSLAFFFGEADLFGVALFPEAGFF